MATARLRKAFRYPDGSDNEPPELDEEQQEKLIADLSQRDAANSSLYRKLFTVIPAGASVYFLVSMCFAPTMRDRLISFLSLSSLVASTYILLMIPAATSDTKGKKPVYIAEREESPVRRYLPYLNAALAGTLLLYAFVSWRRGLHEDAAREATPAVIFALTLFVRQELRPLQVQELQNARYELKGA